MQKNKRYILFIVLGIVILNLIYFLMPNSSKKVVLNRITKGIEIKDTNKGQVKENEKVIKAASFVRSKIAKIYLPLNDSMKQDEIDKVIIARGIIINENEILVPKSLFTKEMPYSIIIPGKSGFSTVKVSEVRNGFVVFRVNKKMSMIATIKDKDIKIKEDVVAVGGTRDDFMAKGKVLKLYKEDNSEFIKTSIPSSNLIIGTPLVSLDKEVIGLYAKKDNLGNSIFKSVKNE